MGTYTPAYRARLGLEEIARMQRPEIVASLLEQANIQEFEDGLRWLRLSNEEQISMEVAAQRNSVIE